MKNLTYLSALLVCTSFATLSAEPKAPVPAKKCHDVSYNAYVDYLILQPNGSNLYYAVEAIPIDPTIPNGIVSPNWNVYEIKPDYQSGFKVGTNAIFNNTDLKIKLTYERIHSQDSASTITGTAATDMLGPMSDIGPNSHDYKTASGNFVSHFDGINLIFGKRLHFSNGLNMTMYAGGGFTRILQSIESEFSNNAGTTTRTFYNLSKFTGAGPQVSLNFACKMFSDFYFKGNSTVTFLVGQMKNTINYSSTSPILAGLSVPQPNTQTTNVPHRTQLVPGLEQKLGFTYLAAFDCCKFSLGLGYQCQIYMNAVQTVDMTAPQVLPDLVAQTPTTGLYAVGFERTLSNYILTGPYLEAGIQF